MKNIKGKIFNIQNFSVHDGQGIRSTIFLAGCPLRCRWCANPESWTFDNPYIKEVSLEEVVQEIKRNIIFFRHSGGGVTYSGGEPSFQKDFLKAMIDYFYELGLDQAIETSAYFAFDKLRPSLEKLDFIFLDIKHMDSSKHKELTGVDNKLILENIEKMGQLGIEILVRVPLIPGINDDKENLTKTADFVKKNLTASSIELLPYHKLGNYKYDKLGLGKYKHVYRSPSDNELAEARGIIEDLGVKTIEFK